MNVFNVIERNGRERWVKIGEATQRIDGCVSVTLDAYPIDGRLCIEPSQLDKLAAVAGHLLSALRKINKDKDGSGFVCKEAMPQIEKLLGELADIDIV